MLIDVGEERLREREILRMVGCLGDVENCLLVRVIEIWICKILEVVL